MYCTYTVQTRLTTVVQMWPVLEETKRFCTKSVLFPVWNFYDCCVTNCKEFSHWKILAWVATLQYIWWVPIYSYVMTWPFLIHGTLLFWPRFLRFLNALLCSNKIHQQKHVSLKRSEKSISTLFSFLCGMRQNFWVALDNCKHTHQTLARLTSSPQPFEWMPYMAETHVLPSRSGAHHIWLSLPRWAVLPAFHLPLRSLLISSAAVTTCEEGEEKKKKRTRREKEKEVGGKRRGVKKEMKERMEEK